MGSGILDTLRISDNRNYEHTILNQDSLTDPFPTAWPTGKDDSEESEEEKVKGSNNGIRRSKSRYLALER